MPKIQSVTTSASTEDIMAIIEQDGCVVIDDAINSDALTNLTSFLQSKLSHTQNCSGDFYGYRTKRLSGLVSKSQIIRDMITHTQILDVMNKVLLPHCDAYQLNLTQAISIGPSEPQQVIHRDDSMFPFDTDKVESMVNCMWAVDDFTEENGATHVVPGSHKWKRDRLPEEHETTQATMKKGSVLIYLGSLIHGGGANKTNQSRTGLVLSYCCGWLRQAENLYLATPLSEVKTYDETLQRLLGYFVHKPNLGSVDGRDPIELLQDIKNNQVFTEYIPEEVQPMIKEFREQQIKAA